MAVVISLCVFLGMVVCLELGYRMGRYVAKKAENAHEGTSTIQAAVFALLGLLLGFTFANGISHLDQRRLLIIQESNAIGTAYLRLDLLPASQQPEMHQLFREYLEARLGAYEKLPDLKAAGEELALASQLQQKIWSHAIAASSADPTQNVARLLLPALNDMIDVTTSRTGYDMARRRSRSWFHGLLYAVVISITIFTVLDLDYPRFGLIRLTAADNALTRLRDSIR